MKEPGHYAFTVKVHASNFLSSGFSNIINYEVFGYYVNAIYIDEANPVKHLAEDIVNKVLCCGKSEVESMVDIIDKFKLNNIEGYSFKDSEAIFDGNNKINLTYYYVSNTVNPDNPGGGEDPENPGGGGEEPENPGGGGSDCGTTCTGSCQSTCSDKCSGSCTGTCMTTCSQSCADNCRA